MLIDKVLLFRLVLVAIASIHLDKKNLICLENFLPADFPILKVNYLSAILSFIGYLVII